MARQTPVGARPNRRRGAVLFDQDAAGRLLEGAGDRVPREMIIRSNTLRQNPAYRPGNSRSIRWGILTASTLLACYTRVPEQTIAIPPAAKPPDAPLVASVWTPRPGALAREYLVENSARVVTTTGSGSTDDSTAIVIQASIRQVAGGGFAGLLRDIVVSSPSVARTQMPGVVLPYPFAAPGVGQETSTRPPEWSELAPVVLAPTTYSVRYAIYWCGSPTPSALARRGRILGCLSPAGRGSTLSSRVYALFASRRLSPGRAGRCWLLSERQGLLCAAFPFAAMTRRA